MRRGVAEERAAGGARAPRFAVQPTTMADAPRLADRERRSVVAFARRETPRGGRRRAGRASDFNKIHA